MKTDIKTWNRTTKKWDDIDLVPFLAEHAKKGNTWNTCISRAEIDMTWNRTATLDMYIDDEPASQKLLEDTIRVWGVGDTLKQAEISISQHEEITVTLFIGWSS